MLAGFQALLKSGKSQGNFVYRKKPRKNQLLWKSQENKVQSRKFKVSLVFYHSLFYFRAEFTALEKDAIKNDMVLVSVKHS